MQAGKIRLFFLRKRAAGDPRRLVGKKFREKPFIAEKSLCFFFAAFHQRTQLTTQLHTVTDSYGQIDQIDHDLDHLVPPLPL